MKTLFIFMYIVITVVTILYTYKKTNEGKNYVEEVHGHMASIMFFHLSIISILITLQPAFLNNIYISILNTLLSIMFSLLFYLTEKTDKKLLYFYNAFYLVFASILMSEIILWIHRYFGNDTFVYSFMLIYCIFISDLLLYNKKNKNKLLIGYSVFSVVSLIVGGIININFIYSYIFSGLYMFLVIGYMYYDHDYLEKNEEKHHLIDSLKYFLDFEGMIVRTIDHYYLEK